MKLKQINFRKTQNTKFKLPFEAKLTTGKPWVGYKGFMQGVKFVKGQATLKVIHAGHLNKLRRMQMLIVGLEILIPDNQAGVAIEPVVIPEPAAEPVDAPEIEPVIESIVDEKPAEVEHPAQEAPENTVSLKLDSEELIKLLKTELQAMAEAHGIDTSGMLKVEIVKALIESDD